jgi:ABC-type Fe3+/spermidine/putrescine transport system ATPase subunit
VELDGVPDARLRVAASDEPVSVGSSVLVAIRPEDLQLHDGPGANVLRCAVENVLYLGAECELLLRAGDVAYTHVVSRSLLPDLGRTIELFLPPRRLRVWPQRPPALMNAEQPAAPRPSIVTAPAASG